jgi:hypothetical protein
MQKKRIPQEHVKKCVRVVTVRVLKHTLNFDKTLIETDAWQRTRTEHVACDE